MSLSSLAFSVAVAFCVRDDYIYFLIPCIMSDHSCAELVAVRIVASNEHRGLLWFCSIDRYFGERCLRRCR